MKKSICLWLFLTVFTIGCSSRNEGIVIEYDHYSVVIKNSNGTVMEYDVINAWQYGEEFKKSKEKKIPVHVEIQRERYFWLKCRERIFWVRFLK